MTVTFIALLFWGWVLGALGALLAIPLTLLLKALLVDVDPRGHWLDALLREEPRAPRTSRARQRAQARRAAPPPARAPPPRSPPGCGGSPGPAGPAAPASAHRPGAQRSPRSGPCTRTGRPGGDTPTDLRGRPPERNVRPREDVDQESGAVPGNTPRRTRE